MSDPDASPGARAEAPAAPALAAELIQAVRLVAAKAFECGPEQAGAAIAALEHRFQNTPPHYAPLDNTGQPDAGGFIQYPLYPKRMRGKSEFEKRRKGIDFADVRAALAADPDAARKLHWMQATGGEPDVVGEDQDFFFIRDCSEQSPLGRRGKTYPEAYGTTQQVGLIIFTNAIWGDMQLLGEFDPDNDSDEWLDSEDEDVKISGKVRFGIRHSTGIDIVFRDSPNQRLERRGWRTELRVRKLRPAAPAVKAA